MWGPDKSVNGCFQTIGLNAATLIIRLGTIFALPSHFDKHTFVTMWKARFEVRIAGFFGFCPGTR